MAVKKTPKKSALARRSASTKKAPAIQKKYTKTEITRGEILDRNGEVLATSIKTKDKQII